MRREAAALRKASLDDTNMAADPQSNAPAAPGSPPSTEGSGDAVRPRRIYHGNNRRVWLLLVVILIGGAGYGVYWWGWVRGTVTTDDAHIEAPIVAVAPRVDGRVAEVTVAAGDQVAAGAVLARLQADRLTLERDQRQANLRQAQARLDELLHAPRPEELAVAEAQVRVAALLHERRRKELRRARALARAQAISAQEVDAAEDNLAEAASRLTVSRKELALLRAGSVPDELEQARAAVTLAEAQLAVAQTNLDDTTVRAPVAGVVARRSVEPGEYVRAGQGLFQIVDLSHTWIVANLEEDEIAHVRAGQPVTIWVDAYAGQRMRGRVGPLFQATVSQFSLLPTASASGSYVKVTQRVPVRIDWEQAHLPPMLPGLNVVVRINTRPGEGPPAYAQEQH